MTRVSCQKIWGSIPGSPKWSDDSWRLCICKVPTPTPSPREGRTNWGQSTQDFIFLTSHIQQQRLFVSKGGESEQRAFHASLHIIYFSFSTTTTSYFQGRGDRTNGNSCEPLYYLLLILNNNASCFQGRRGWTESNSCEPSHHLLHIFNKQMLLVFKGGESELTTIHAGLYIIYFSFLTNNASCFQGRRERTEGNPRELSPHLLLILNKQRPLVCKGRETASWVLIW